MICKNFNNKIALALAIIAVSTRNLYFYELHLCANQMRKGVTILFYLKTTTLFIQSRSYPLALSSSAWSKFPPVSHWRKFRS